MDDASLRKAIPWELEGKLPINPATALIRHLVAGDVYHEQQPAHEVIVLAAERETVEQLLAAAGKARLDIAGLDVSTGGDRLLLNIYRKSDAAVTNLFIDIGATGTRATIARGGQILFARAIPIGGEHFNDAITHQFNLTPAEARELRRKLADDERRGAPTPTHKETSGSERSAGSSLVGSASRTVPSVTQAMVRDADPTRSDVPTSSPSYSGDWAGVRGDVASGIDRESVEQAIAAPLERLTEELALCRRYHEATFPDFPVQRLVFVERRGPAARLCTSIARLLGIAAQVGDPLVRMARTTEVEIESGIDRRLPQPAWAIAIGLSMGTPGNDPANGSLT